MTISKSFVLILIFSILVLAFALPVFAQSGTTNCGAGQKCLENPLRFASIEKFVEGLLKAVVVIALPIITVFMVYAGFMFIKARGKPDELKTARNNFVYVIIGATLILSAWVLATLIGSTVTQLIG